MQSKTTQLQSTIRPTTIRLSPFTKLPKLKGFSPSKQTNNSFIIKQKTQSSKQQQRLKNQRLKTQPQYKDEQSASFRLLSRFIYNHLQKKINFNAQIITNYPDLSMGMDYRNMIKQRSSLLSNKSNEFFSDYQQNPSRESNRTLLLKFKNRHTKGKGIHKSMGKGQGNSNKNRYANIDSYFDLSCLEQNDK